MRLHVTGVYDERSNFLDVEVVTADRKVRTVAVTKESIAALDEWRWFRGGLVCSGEEGGFEIPDLFRGRRD